MSPWTPAHDSRFERILFLGSRIALGRFELSAGDPKFADTGPTRHHVAVVPELPVWLERRDRESEVADPGRVVLHNAGVPYRRRALDWGDRCWWIALRDPAAAGLGAPDAARPFRDPSVALPADRLLEFQNLLDRLDSTSGDEVERRVLGLLRSTLGARGDGETEGRPRSESPVPDDHRDLAERARATVAACFREKVPLPEIASEVAASPSHLGRVFRRVHGRTLQEHRNDLRLRSALFELHRRPDRDLTDLALDLGYSSHSHFTACFRRRFGHPPSALRR